MYIYILYVYILVNVISCCFFFFLVVTWGKKFEKIEIKNKKKSWSRTTYGVSKNKPLLYL